MGNALPKLGLLAVLVLLIALSGLLGAIVWSRPDTGPRVAAKKETYVSKQGDEELAYLLVKLELKTRTVIAGHYTRAQSPVPGVDAVYKRWIAKNAILPAAVADRIFADVVPGVTGGRAWVRMVVEEPRNPNNRGDPIALELLEEVREEVSAERSTADAYYYAEPIKTTGTCLPCHGEPRGARDPFFPEYEKNGWKEGEVVGAVIARVAPAG